MKEVTQYFIVNNLNCKYRENLLNIFKSQPWVKNTTLEDIKAMEGTCVIFGLIEKNSDTLVGFSRVLTDELKYAYIHDVIVADRLQGRGMGRYLLETILNHPSFKKIVCFEVLCRPDKIPFYNKFKFKEHDYVRALRYDKRQNKY